MSRAARLAGDARPDVRTRPARIALVADVRPVHRPLTWPPRDPPRPPDRRQPDYDTRFDADTLWFDVVALRGRLVAVGPPVRAWAPLLADAAYRVDGAPVRAAQTRVRDRTQTTVLPLRGGAAPDAEVTVTLPAPHGTLTTHASPDQTALFAGRRVLFTVSKDNDLAWVQDWLRWHVRVHGTDAVVVYDNASTAYSTDELLAALTAVDDVAVAVVVPWRFPYGPGGNGEQDWDSDFAQIGAMEHARHRFLRRAAGVLNADIDELVHTRTGVSVYEYARRSPSGFVAFHGRWAHRSPTADPQAPVRHADSTWTSDDDDPCPFKWCGVPARMPARAQWLVHGSWNLHVDHVHDLWYSHHRAVSTHWKVDRTTAAHTAEHSRYDAGLADDLAAHLGEHPRDRLAASTATVKHRGPVPSRAARIGTGLLTPRLWRRLLGRGVRRAYHAAVAIGGR